MICLCIMTFTPFGDLYCDRSKTDLCEKPLINVTEADQDKFFDFEAPDRGGFFIMLAMLVSFGYVFGICLVPCVFVVFMTIFVVVEKKTPRTPLTEWAAMFWNLPQKRVMWQTAPSASSPTSSRASTTPGAPMSQLWASVEPLNDGLSTVLGSLIFSAILVVVGKYGFAWNWRWTIAISSLGVVAVDGFVIFITIWDASCATSGSSRASRWPTTCPRASASSSRPTAPSRSPTFATKARPTASSRSSPTSRHPSPASHLQVHQPVL
jgi:hypothetical protein